ncbi:MAG: diacylglycerol kinase family protein [Clostridia bacterium]|nr:diacylglycerol kinase family protein [Clostridia bacterium]
MKILKSFLYALQGLKYCIITQRNFRFHIVAAVSVLIASLFYNFSKAEMMWLWFAILFVLICEMINTAIESAIDMHGGEYNINAKISKDVAAGAVMLSAIMAFVIAITLFWDIDVIVSVIYFFVERPYMWIILAIYVAVAVCFVTGLIFKKHNR